MQYDQEPSCECGRVVKGCVSGHGRWVCPVGVSISKIFKKLKIYKNHIVRCMSHVSMVDMTSVSAGVAMGVSIFIRKSKIKPSQKSQSRIVCQMSYWWVCQLCVNFLLETQKSQKSQKCVTWQHLEALSCLVFIHFWFVYLLVDVYQSACLCVCHRESQYCCHINVICHLNLPEGPQ